MQRYERAPLSRQLELPESSTVLEFPSRERGDTPAVTIRSFERRDTNQVVALAQQNFQTTYTLSSDEVVRGYMAANSRDELLEAVEQRDGREAYVAVTPQGRVAGFLLLEYNPYKRRSRRGELAILRLHVDPTIQKQGIGKTLFALAEQRGEEIMVNDLVSQSSGSSRPFFELNGWTGRTELSNMKKKGTSAIIWACRKPVGPQEYTLYPAPTHVIYAGSSTSKQNFLMGLTEGIDNSVKFMAVPSIEPPVDDVYESARAKAYSVKLTQTSGTTPLIIAGDIRTQLFCSDRANNHRTDKLLGRGKPQGRPLVAMEEIRQNFQTLLDTARRTQRPAPYVVRSCTYLRDPNNPRADTFTEYDISVWLTEKGLQELASRKGHLRYRDEVKATYKADVVDMSAGFALPFFLSRGYVAGLNGHPLPTLPHREEFIEKALHTVLIGIDGDAVAQRLGHIG